MTERAKRGARRDTVRRRGLETLASWKLEDAKARFSEVVRRARAGAPQRVTYRGEDAVVVVAAAEFKRLQGRSGPTLGLVDFLRATGLGAIDVVRERDRGREPRL
ncbi:MAG: type II toxin-antitoxin system prevent-host-death family antitoxin [Alphaproteobacteria bacterium]